jgi:hypothetical protein
MRERPGGSPTVDTAIPAEPARRASRGPRAKPLDAPATQRADRCRANRTSRVRRCGATRWACRRSSVLGDTSVTGVGAWQRQPARTGRGRRGPVGGRRRRRPVPRLSHETAGPRSAATDGLVRSCTAWRRRGRGTALLAQCRTSLSKITTMPRLALTSDHLTASGWLPPARRAAKNPNHFVPGRIAHNSGTAVGDPRSRRAVPRAGAPLRALPSLDHPAPARAGGCHPGLNRGRGCSRCSCPRWRKSSPSASRCKPSGRRNPRRSTHRKALAPEHRPFTRTSGPAFRDGQAAGHHDGGVQDGRTTISPLAQPLHRAGTAAPPTTVEPAHAAVPARCCR